MPDLSERFLEAALDRYKADRAEAVASIHLLVHNPVGIGDHSDILNEIDKWVKSLSESEEKIATLKNNFSHLLSCHREADKT